MAKALVFAGGTGVRMNTRAIPKQFLEVNGKAILIYTLEKFENHKDIDSIIVVCKENWMNRFESMLKKFNITKVKKIVPGGNTAHESIYNGLLAMKTDIKSDEIVLIHDGVRPFITEELISLNIESVKKYGTAITVEPARESIIRCIDGENVNEVPPREQMYIAKAPQSFYFNDIIKLYDRAHDNSYITVDSAHLCEAYGFPIHIVRSTANNIKITEPIDFYVFKALLEEEEHRQILGV